MKLVKKMIIINAVLGFLFIIANLVYAYFSLPPKEAIWSPLWLTFSNFDARATIGDIGVQEPNFSFYFFWILLIVNVFFLLKLK